MGKMLLGHGRWQLARTVTRRPENKGWSKALFAQLVGTPSDHARAEVVTHTHERRTRDGQARARADAQALVPDIEVLDQRFANQPIHSEPQPPTERI